MQLRFDGTLGFPGGMVDSEETPASSLTRVFEEDAGDLVFIRRYTHTVYSGQLLSEDWGQEMSHPVLLRAHP